MKIFGKFHYEMCFQRIIDMKEEILNPPATGLVWHTKDCVIHHEK